MKDVTEADIGKPIFTAEEHKIGTLRGMDGPTLYIKIADDIDPALRSDMKVSEITWLKDDGDHLAGAARASVADVTDDEIHFWPTYAAEAEHESVTYDEIPEEESHDDPSEL
ncbi:hypothetical protein [Halocatena pleomorpha]|uniref:Uncharacterized protein n=1 Tax=Halocatena pleomorpha TaxID=1785090 RepID=A0A3P3RDC1_9EURY|nr:hypothetical protein [Halocatena pleomorpha]RRJ31492.1 hypothetical protein EIK79_07200 [Halocatena pleomorpha]